MRLAEGVQAGAPVEQVAATAGLRVAAELHHMWALPCSVRSQCAHGAVQVRGSEADFLGKGLPCFRKECAAQARRSWDQVQVKDEVWRPHCAAKGLDSLPGGGAKVPTSAQPAHAVEAVGGTGCVGGRQAEADVGLRRCHVGGVPAWSSVRRGQQCRAVLLRGACLQEAWVCGLRVQSFVATPERWCDPMQPPPNEPAEEWHTDPRHLSCLMRPTTWRPKSPNLKAAADFNKLSLSSGYTAPVDTERVLTQASSPASCPQLC